MKTAENFFDFACSAFAGGLVLLLTAGHTLAAESTVNVEIMTFQNALLAAIGALTGAIVFMYAWWIKGYESLKTEHLACIERERVMLERVIRLEERTGTERRTIPPLSTKGESCSKP